MQAEIGPAPGSPGISTLTDGPCGYSCGIGSQAFEQMMGQGIDKNIAVKAQAKELAYAKTELFEQIPISMFFLETKKVQFTDKVTGKLRYEETLVSPEFGAISSFTDAGEHNTGNPESYQKILSKANQLAKTEGNASMFWVSPGEPKKRDDGVFVPESRAYIWKKDKSGLVTAYQYLLTGSENSLSEMFNKLGFKGNDTRLEDQVILRKDKEFSHQEVFSAFESSLNLEEKSVYKPFIENFRIDSRISDEVRNDKFEKYTQRFENELQKEYQENHKDMHQALEHIVHGFIALAQNPTISEAKALPQQKDIRHPKNQIVENPSQLQQPSITKNKFGQDLSEEMVKSEQIQEQSVSASILAEYERKRKRKKDIIRQLPAEKPEKPDSKETADLRVYEEFVQHSSKFQEFIADSESAEFHQSPSVQEIHKPDSPLLAEYERKKSRLSGIPQAAGKKEIIPQLEEDELSELKDQESDKLSIFADFVSENKKYQEFETEIEEIPMENNIESDESPELPAPALFLLQQGQDKKSENPATKEPAREIVDTTPDPAFGEFIVPVSFRKKDVLENVKLDNKDKATASLLTGILLLKDSTLQNVEISNDQEITPENKTIPLKIQKVIPNKNKSEILPTEKITVKETFLVPAIIYLSKLIKESNQDIVETASPKPQELLKDTKIIESDPKSDTGNQKALVTLSAGMLLLQEVTSQNPEIQVQNNIPAKIEIKSSNVENKELESNQTEIIQNFKETFLVPAVIYLTDIINKSEIDDNKFITLDEKKPDLPAHVVETIGEEQKNKSDQSFSETIKAEKKLATLIAGILLLQDGRPENIDPEQISGLPQTLKQDVQLKEVDALDLPLQEKETIENFKETFLVPAVVHLIAEITPKTDSEEVSIQTKENNINSLITGIHLLQSDLTSNVITNSPQSSEKIDAPQNLKETFFVPALINLIEITIESVPDRDVFKSLAAEKSDQAVFQEAAKREEPTNNFDQKDAKINSLENNLSTLFAGIMLLHEDTSQNIKPEQITELPHYKYTKSKSEQTDAVEINIQEKESFRYLQESLFIPGIINLIEKINEPEIKVSELQLKKPETAIPQSLSLGLELLSTPASYEQNAQKESFLIPAVLYLTEIISVSEIEKPNTASEKPENFLFNEQLENINEKINTLDIGLQVLQLPEIKISDQEAESDYSFFIPAILNLTEALNKTNSIEPAIDFSTEFVKDFNNDADVIKIELKTELIKSALNLLELQNIVETPSEKTVKLESIVVPAFIYLAEDIKLVPDSLLLNKHSQIESDEESQFINQPESIIILTVNNSENIKNKIKTQENVPVPIKEIKTQITIQELFNLLISDLTKNSQLPTHSSPDQNKSFNRRDDQELELQILKSLYSEAKLNKISLENIRISNFALKAEINNLKVLVLILMNLLKYSEAQKKIIYQLLKINNSQKISIETKIHWQSGILFNIKKSSKKKKSIKGMIYQYYPKLHLAAGPLVTLDQFVPK